MNDVAFRTAPPIVEISCVESFRQLFLPVCRCSELLSRKSNINWQISESYIVQVDEFFLLHFEFAISSSGGVKTL